jgi:hypothetical protein
MYNTKFLCTYKMIEDLPDDGEESGDSGDDNKEYANLLYQFQILQAFQLEDWNEEKLLQKKEALYNKIKDVPEFLELMESLNQQNQIMHLMNDADHLTKLSMLFSYDLFHIFHKWIYEHEQKNISQETQNKLLQTIQNI